jgi:4-amino-4-deoxy-L-arabinose transferase-like glycosyltransferase
MLESWHNLFFNAFDPGGFVSLDKPPVAIWLQAASAKLLGFSGIAVLLPQVIEGLVAIVVVHLLVRRAFGDLAGLLAALFLAVTPISVAIDRSNNTDSCLILVLLLALWAFTKALEGEQRGGPLFLAMALIGLAFNVKMGAALVLVPALAAIYLLLARAQPLPRRIVRLGIGGIVLTGVALSWAAICDLVPAASRPYAGSTAHNSMLELALVHNGLHRFTRPAPGTADEPVAAAPTADGSARQPLWDDSASGILRLVRPQHAAQVSWLLPLALAGLLLGLARHRRGELSPAQTTSLALWGGWLASYWLVLSYAGGVVHTYYVAALGPPLAALAGIGVAELWRSSRARLLPAALAVTIAWMAYVAAGSVEWQAAPSWAAWLRAGALLTAAAACLMLVRPGWAGAHAPHAALATALTALLALPLAWALSVVLVRPNVAAPVADLAALMRPDARDVDAARMRRAQLRRDALVSFLRPRQGNERFILAVPNALQAAPLIIATGQPVMAMGGYLGRDQILTPASLASRIARGEVRFILTGGISLVPADARLQALTRWVHANGIPVDRSLWLSRDGTPARLPSAQGPYVIEPAALYDMRRARPAARLD